MSPGPAQAPSRALVAAAAGIALGVTALAGLAALRESAAPLGQIVAVPAATLDEGADGPSLRIDRCTPGPDGLQVRGQVDAAAAAAAGGQLVVAVTGPGAGSGAAAAGRAVAVGFAYTAGFGDVPGEFLLWLPWADARSRLAVLAPDSPVTGVPRTGPGVTCPVAAG